jgi:hypothetical protein
MFSVLLRGLGMGNEGDNANANNGTDGGSGSTDSSNSGGGDQQQQPSAQTAGGGDGVLSSENISKEEVGSVAVLVCNAREMFHRIISILDS